MNKPEQKQVEYELHLLIKYNLYIDIINGLISYNNALKIARKFEFQQLLRQLQNKEEESVSSVLIN